MHISQKSGSTWITQTKAAICTKQMANLINLKVYLAQTKMIWNNLNKMMKRNMMKMTIVMNE